MRDFVLERAETTEFLDRLDGLLRTFLPAYQAEGRSYLTVAIGCTGGRHRSVAIAEEIAARAARPAARRPDQPPRRRAADATAQVRRVRAAYGPAATSLR